MVLVRPDRTSHQTILSVTLFATGALLGDLAKTLKRRLGKERGESGFWPNHDLVIGSFLLIPGLSGVALRILLTHCRLDRRRGTPSFTGR